MGRRVNVWRATALLFSVLRTISVNAAPTAAVQCEKLDKYSVDYFFAAKTYEPAASTCLFYTRVLSNTAMQFARSRGGHMSTIWDLFPCDLYNASPTDTLNPLRCLMNDEQQKRAYFSNMSKAMALSCDVSATVMTHDIENIPQDGIWGGTELPALTGGGRGDRRVDWIDAIDPKGDHATTIWERPERFDGRVESLFLQTDQTMSHRDRTKPIATGLESKTRSKRRASPESCPFVSPAQMRRWWDDVIW